MTTPRHRLVDAKIPMHYHLGSRCVRGSWLCGRDRRSGRDYSHRKQWLEERLLRLGGSFALEVMGYAIMSNHFHVVVYYDPTAASRWTDAEVAERWVNAFPPRKNGAVDGSLKQSHREAIAGNPDLAQRYRCQLGSLSVFMQQLKQPIAWRANQEDGVDGHFFHGRFYSGALLSETGLLAAMAYVDLNPVRARIARHIEDCENTSIARRLKLIENTAERLEEFLAPLASGLEQSAARPVEVRITLSEYVLRLNALIDEDLHSTPSRPTRWYQQVAMLKKRQRAFGTQDELAQWLGRRGMRPLEVPLPDR